jgi:DNA-binding NarL/FixJ family response regulator
MHAEPCQTERLLLIEDCRSDATVIRHYLLASSEAHYEIVAAESLSEALSYAKDRVFDLVLLDLNLPDSAGLATLEHIVAAVPDAPIVVLTGHEDDGIGLACIDAGAQDYLCKVEMTPDNVRTIVSFALGRFREGQAKLLRMVTKTDHALSSHGVVTPVTRALAGAAPIRERRPSAFAALVDDYQTALHGYIDHLNKKKEKPKAEMEILVTQLGDLGANPRDMIDVHTASLDAIRRNVNKSFAYTFAADSRLFALEMMGLLVEYYRTGFRRLPSGRLPT